MHLEPQPFRGFLLKLIHFHNLEHMKGAFLSMVRAIMPPTRMNGNMGQQILQLVMKLPPPPDLGTKSQASNAQA